MNVRLYAVFSLLLISVRAHCGPKITLSVNVSVSRRLYSREAVVSMSGVTDSPLKVTLSTAFHALSRRVRRDRRHRFVN